MADIKINQDMFKKRKDIERHKVVQKDNIFRFLPPLGEESNGYPYHKWFITWGLVDPVTGRSKWPVASSITTEQQCPIFEYCRLLTDKLKVLEAEYLSSGLSEDEAKEKLLNATNYLNNLKPKKSFIWNAVDKAGKVGVLELKASAHAELLDLMEKYVAEYNQDPTSINDQPSDSGVWFNINRTGEKFSTVYKVSKNQTRSKDPVTGGMTYGDDRSSLPDSVKESWESTSYRLDTIYKMRSYEELKEILIANLDSVVLAIPELAIDGFFTPNSSTKTKPLATKSADTKVLANKPVAAVQTKFSNKDATDKLLEDVDGFFDEA